MKGQAVPLKVQHQRKEARRKELLMLTRRKRNRRDWEMPPRIWRAAIYLSELQLGELDGADNKPRIDQQRLQCRCAATVLHAEVVAEFVDVNPYGKPRQGLSRMLELVTLDERIDYLIVSSRDRLASDRDEAFEIAWRLGFASTVVIPADAEDEFPWTDATSPSRE